MSRWMAGSWRCHSESRRMRKTPELGTPVALFAPPLGGAVQQGDYRYQYMVSADGQQFLVAAVTEEANSPITVIVNWKPRR